MLLQACQYSSAQTFDFPATEQKETQQSDSITTFETSLSSSPADLERQSNAQQRIVYSALQGIGGGLLLLAGVIAALIVYSRRAGSDQFGAPGRRHRSRRDH